MLFNKPMFVTNNPSPPPSIDCLCFTSPNSFSVGMANSSSATLPSLEYSKDGTTWTTFTAGTTTVSANANEKVYLRGNNDYISSNEVHRTFVLTGSDIRASGNIMSLLDETCESTTITTIYCFDRMFNGCTSLTTPPTLPATTLANSCYYGMFYNCTSLTTAPELPATTMTQYCYSNMFEGCTGLITAPELPATTLARDCYKRMFYGCTSLTTAPELPATTVYSESYDSMFAGCNSLTEPPELPATTLGTYCYSSMFANCALLEKISKLPATTLAESCYAAMFASCPNVKISATQTGDYVYPFRIPTEGTATSANNCTNNMFMNTGGTYKGNGPINYTYYTDHEPV